VGDRLIFPLIVVQPLFGDFFVEKKQLSQEDKLYTAIQPLAEKVGYPINKIYLIHKKNHHLLEETGSPAYVLPCSLDIISPA
jgi:hypothetical protein